MGFKQFSQPEYLHKFFSQSAPRAHRIVGVGVVYCVWDFLCVGGRLTKWIRKKNQLSRLGERNMERKGRGKLACETGGVSVGMCEVSSASTVLTELLLYYSSCCTLLLFLILIFQSKRQSLKVFYCLFHLKSIQ